MSADVIAVEIGPGEFVSIPLSGHAASVLAPALTGGFLAVCFCSDFAVIRDTEDEAAAELDAHITAAVA